MESEDLFSKRAASFGATAADYHRHRPGYPAGAIEWALGDRDRVLDLAAGTGKLTEGLLDLGAEVTAVEPDPLMRAEFTRRFPDVPMRDGTAESIPLRDASVEAVLVGQAYHWFDPATALPEITRVLRPGGVLGVFWNHDDDSVPWVSGLLEVTQTSVGAGRSRPGRVPEHRDLKPPEQVQVHHAQRRTVDSMLGTLLTHSHISQASEQERETVLARALSYLKSHSETADGEFDRPLITTVVRAVRR
ncbi:class I SAM-dependent methyltransferase [Actinokineospora pegani]|uniref:class I SAM-dependent methyltransferase n=1 Tax=Actinokineospora pegani TaxID=2654637 RepID=UPI0012EACEB6|nr:class I SAM-dependent methyltransferase [Actinokineospora pegani]